MMARRISKKTIGRVSIQQFRPFSSQEKSKIESFSFISNNIDLQGVIYNWGLGTKGQLGHERFDKVEMDSINYFLLSHYRKGPFLVVIFIFRKMLEDLSIVPELRKLPVALDLT
jgi:alpha-tubulin suppressor-like RCC1 family protein